MHGFYSGDCRQLIKPGSTNLDVMIVDPPYSAHVHKAAVSQSPVRGVRKRDLGFDHLSGGLMQYICQMAAGVERWSCIYSDVESVGAWKLNLEEAGATYIRAIPWVRWSMPQLSGDRPPTGCEMIVIAWGKKRGKKWWNGPGNLLSFDHKCLRGEGKHRAEKPLDQLLDLVNFFSDVGETVVDPCAGSGTTGVACHLLGRDFIGCELAPMWHAHALGRLEAASKRELSPRDLERNARWADAQLNVRREMARMASQTAKIREKVDAAR